MRGKIFHPDPTKHGKKKFEPKVILWITMTPKGLSTPVLKSGRSMSVTARSYVDNCLEPHLIPFLNTHYHHEGPTSFRDSSNVNNVKKEDNLTKFRSVECRPVEDFFSVLATRVYHRNWVAKDVAALKKRIRKGISEIPPAIVQTTMESVRTRLLQAWRVGVLKVFH